MTLNKTSRGWREERNTHKHVVFSPCGASTCRVGGRDHDALLAKGTRGVPSLGPVSSGLVGSPTFPSLLAVLKPPPLSLRSSPRVRDCRPQRPHRLHQQAEDFTRIRGRSLALTLCWEPPHCYSLTSHLLDEIKLRDIKGD